VTAADRQWWMENTAPGMLARAMGRDPFSIDRAEVDAQVEGVRQHYRAVYQRELSEAEVASVRYGAELRSAAPAMREVPQSVPDIVAMVNSRNVGAGWYWQPGRPPGSGIAMRGPDGSWTGDPDVVDATRRGQAERDAAAAAAEDAYRNGPAVLRTIARPT